MTRNRVAKTRRPDKGEVLICVGCLERIHGAYVRDLTKQPWHKTCRKLGVKATTALYSAPPRYEGLTTTECGGCGMDVNQDEPRVTVSAVPWHRECYLRR